MNANSINALIKGYVEEVETARREEATRVYDDRLSEDWIKLIELALERPGYFAGVAREHAPRAFARVGAPNKA